MTPHAPLAGRYRPLRPLDAEGSAWHAADELLHRDVTVRRVPADTLAAARAATALKHRGVVTVHDVVTDDEGAAWAVTEPADGTTLYTAGLLPQPVAAALGLDLLDALAHAHALGIVHGGVEPGTVVRCADGRFALTGFGTARPSPAFTPPEPDRTPASDLWGLAATLCAAAEGRPPFAGPDALRYGQPLPAVRAPRLAAAVQPALHPDPAGRATAPALAAGLRRLVPSARDRGPLRIHPALLGAAALALLAVTVPVTVAFASPDPVAKSTTTSPRLTAVPDACKLLTDEQIAQLVPGTDEPMNYMAGTCNWRTATGLGDLPGTLSLSLDVKVALVNNPGDSLKSERRMASYGGGEVIELGGPGDDGFVKETLMNLSGSGDRFMTEVVFRQANAVVTVEFTRSGPASAALRQAAIRGAYWIAEELRRA
ncbi:hypothetical protein EDD29_4012 [Actinocorallia herbida]|uniref:non-specific serine/threonine protein kinase n=1 Tax=Actinocorallia herbida TaxID=58109 RepID=A0A3N1CYT2_9ACTN|nr:hypothetical protein [Actinocorallia herbida]ROO86441.1 hypothetical protein EDD29_4012 [Actinocorallia herbida]